MKKILSLTFVIMMALSLTACGKKGITVAMLTCPNLTSNELTTKVVKEIAKPQVSLNYKYYSDDSSMVKDLIDKKINFINCEEVAGNMLVNRNSGFNVLTSDRASTFDYAMCFEEENIVVVNQISDAIRDMRKDGTMEKLIKEHIIDVVEGDDPEIIELPVLNTRLHMTIGVTGEVSPLDTVDKEGHAAGFTGALLYELSKRLGINIDTVKLSYDDRYTALQEGKCDGIFFTHLEKTSNAKLKYKDVLGECITTEPYYTGRDILVYSEDNEETVNHIENFMRD